VLVSRTGNTDRTELNHTRELLDRMGHTPTGVVVIGEIGAGDAYETYGSSIADERPSNGRVAPAPEASPAPRARASSEREGRKGGELSRGKKTKSVPYP